ALNELLSGMESLKASGAEHLASHAWAGKAVEVMNISLKQGSVATYLQSILSSLGTLGPMLLLVGGVVEVMNNQLTPGTMLSANALAVGFISPVMNLVGTFQSLQLAHVQMKRIDDVLESAPEQDHAPAVSVAPKLKGAIELDRVNFRYDAKLPLVVKD